MSEPVAYFITWTCRGTWLHGDARGSFERITGAKRAVALPPDPTLRQTERGARNHAPLLLDPATREIVESALREASDHRSWRIHAIAVRSNHVHIVVGAPGRTPESVMQQLKSRATVAIRSAGRAAPDQQPWTRHGSTKYLWKHEELAAAIEYVNDWQDRPRG